MKHVFLLSIFAFFMLSCGEESKPTPEKKTIQPAKTNGNQLIPMTEGNKWTYDAWRKYDNKNYEITCVLTEIGKYNDMITSKELSMFSFEFEDDDIYDLRYEYTCHADTVIKLYSGDRGVLYYPYNLQNTDGEQYGFYAWINDYQVNNFVFDMVHVYKNNVSGLETYLYYCKGIGLVHAKSFSVGELTNEYKIKSAVLK